MIVLYTGRRGAGKTLTMTKDAYQYYKKGVTVFSNIELGFPHEYINESDILKIDSSTVMNNCVLVIDEIQILLDSRRSGRGENVNFSHFIQQIRKRNIIVLATTQFTGTVDLRLRQHVDIIAKPQYMKKYKVCKVTYIDLTVVDDYDLYEGQPQNVIIVYDARPIFNMYDTFKIVGSGRKKKEKKKEV